MTKPQVKKPKRDSYKRVCLDMIDAAIPCHNGATGRKGACHGVADSTNLVRRARALVKGVKRG